MATAVYDLHSVKVSSLSVLFFFYWQAVSTSDSVQFTGCVTYNIELCDTSTPEDIIIGHELVAAGHAIGSPGSVQVRNRTLLLLIIDLITI